MGWNGGTEIFDKFMTLLLDDDMTKTEKIEKFYSVLQDGDWDTENESDYFHHPLVEEVFQKLWPHWYDDYENGE